MDNREEFIAEFLCIYKQHKALWQIKAKCYMDRKLRSEGLQKLLDFYKTVNAAATLDTVKKKINNLRSAFRKELKKVKKSKKSGNATDDIYVPTLWYYKLLLFTADHEESRDGISNDTSEDEEINKAQLASSHYETANFSQSFDEDIPTSPGDSMSTTAQSQLYDTNAASEQLDDFRPASAASTSTAEQSHVPQPPTKSFKRKRPHSEQLREELLLKVGQQLDLKDDDFDITGKHIANKLRSLPKDTALIAETILMDVLYEAQLGNINKNSKPAINYAIQKSFETNVPLWPWDGQKNQQQYQQQQQHYQQEPQQGHEPLSEFLSFRSHVNND